MRPSSQRGFTLVQISILLTVASLVMVTMLPTSQTKLTNNNVSTTRMNAVLTALRNYQASNGYLPCPANPYLPIGNPLYGVASPYTTGGTTNNCINGTATSANTATAAYADTTQKIALGMLPVNALNLSNDYALDGYGRTITYAVDTTATNCWPTTTLPGKITVNDNGTATATVLALVSHGADGYGAWLPMTNVTGTVTRLDNGSTDMYQADNAQVNNGGTSGGLTANGAGQFQPFYKKAPTATFDDMVAYKNPAWNFNTEPTVVQKAQASLVITPPANGDYKAPNVLTFTLTYPQAVTVTGTPRLDLAAISGGGSIGTGNVGYAVYTPGSSTSTALAFTYTVQSGDLATSGLTMTPTIDLNGGSITPNPCNINFTAPDLSGVIIGQVFYATDRTNNRVEMFSLSGKYIKQFPCASGACTASGSAGQLNAPGTIAVDPSGNVWVGDYFSHVSKFDLNGNYLNVQYNPAHATSIGQLYSIAVDSSGNVWSGTSNKAVDEYDTNGNYLATLCNNSYVNNSGISCSGSSSNGYFGGVVSGLVFDASDHLWVTDKSNVRLEEFSTASGGRAFMQSATSSSPSFATPGPLAADAGQDVWVTDGNNGNGFVREFYSSGTQASLYGINYGGQTYINNPYGIMFDPSGNLWLGDDQNNNIVEVNPASGALITTIGGAGTGNGQFYNSADSFIALATKPLIPPQVMYVSNCASSGTVSVINRFTNAITATISVGNCPTYMITSGNYLYVMNAGDNTISVVNTGNNTVVATLSVSSTGGSNPGSFATYGNYVYAVNHNGTHSTVSVISTVSNTVVAAIPVGGNGYSMTIYGAYAYVTNYGDGTVSVISLANNTVIATIPVGSNPGNIITAGAYVYVQNQTTVSVINPTSNTVVATITPPNSPGQIGSAGGYVYVVSQGGNNASIISTSSNTLVTTVAVGSTPLAVAGSGGNAYVVNQGSNTVSVISTASNTVVASPGVVGGAQFDVGYFGYVYVVGGSGVSVINASSNSTVATIGGLNNAVALTMAPSR